MKTYFFPPATGHDIRNINHDVAAEAHTYDALHERDTYVIQAALISFGSLSSVVTTVQMLMFFIPPTLYVGAIKVSFMMNDKDPKLNRDYPDSEG